jgi:hypothetical protein
MPSYQPCRAVTVAAPSTKLQALIRALADEPHRDQPVSDCKSDELTVTFPAVDTVPDYTDTAAQSALWKYKAIYRQGDDRAGQWSNVVSVAVAG